jgi:hypothetical protein
MTKCLMEVFDAHWGEVGRRRRFMDTLWWILCYAFTLALPCVAMGSAGLGLIGTRIISVPW